MKYFVLSIASSQFSSRNQSQLTNIKYIYNLRIQYLLYLHKSFNNLFLIYKNKLLNDTNSNVFKTYMKQIFIYSYKNLIIQNKSRFKKYNYHNFYLTNNNSKSKSQTYLYQEFFKKKKFKLIQNKLNNMNISFHSKSNKKKYLFYQQNVFNLKKILNTLPKVIVKMNKRNCFITVCNYDNTVIKHFSIENAILKKKIKQLNMRWNISHTNHLNGFLNPYIIINFN